MKKNELCVGDVILFPPQKGDFIAQAIAFLTDGEVNHAALCYPGEAGIMVAESILKDGLVLSPFPEHIDEEYPLGICRLKGQSDMTPVLLAAQRYLEEKNSYPNFNLGLLGTLLLFKKFASHTWNNKVVYRFAALIAYELMQIVRKRKYIEKHPMSCSQFVAQCFTDAGEKYDLAFETLVVDFEVYEQQVVMTRNLTTNGRISPIEMLEQEENSSIPAMNILPDSYLMQMRDSDKTALVSEFMNVASSEKIATRALNTPGEPVSSSALKKVMTNIAFSIYELQTGVSTADFKKVITYMKSETARNFFVAPQDLLINCSGSLKYIGDLSY